MREYGQIQTSFWTSPEVQSFTDHGKLLATYLLTGPHSNGLGSYRIPDGYVMADFGWTSERVSKGFEELFKTGFCSRCETTFFIVIPNFLKWNPIANGNVAAARIKEFESVPKDCSIYKELCHSFLKNGNHLPNPFINRLETVSKGYAKQDPTLPYPEPEPTQPERKGTPVVIPDGLNVEAWEQYVEYRRKTKLKKLKPVSVNEQLRWLVDQGDSKTQQDIVNKTIRNGHQGLFELKQGNNQPPIGSKRNERLRKELAEPGHQIPHDHW